MFHRRCDQLIEELRRQNEDLRGVNEGLVQSLADHKGLVVPTFAEQCGEVYYMDDARQVELGENGTSAT